MAHFKGRFGGFFNTYYIIFFEWGRKNREYRVWNDRRYSFGIFNPFREITLFSIRRDLNNGLSIVVLNFEFSIDW